MKRLKKFADDNPARIAAVVSSLAFVVFGILFPHADIANMVVLLMAFLGLGEYAQRKENTKTADALATEPPTGE